MKKLLSTLALGAAIFAMAAPATAQDNVLANKPIYPLGEPKTWSVGEEGQDGYESYTFKTEDLQKLVKEPTNTDNVFLYPENGKINTAENQAKGAQAFYIDLGKTTSLGNVFTTWEGAAADTYNIYLMDVEPTLENLPEEPTYHIEGLGQYTAHTAVLPEHSKGQYLVFEPIKATNWGWGVKIRSISATEPQEDVLSSFVITPGIVADGETTPVKLTFKNQFGVELAESDVEIKITGDAIYENGNLTVNSGNKVEFTATLGETLTANVYVADAPATPVASEIKTPIYTNAVTDYNDKAEFTVAYNGGATNAGEMVFTDGEVARLITETQCVFLSNSETTGAWNGNISPKDKGYQYFCIDIFADRDVEGTVEFEGVNELALAKKIPFNLTAGEWTEVKVDVEGASLINNISVRFTEENIVDILIANVYFTAASTEWKIAENPANDKTNVNTWIKQGTLFAANVTDFSEHPEMGLTHTVYFKSPNGEQIYYTVSKDAKAVRALNATDPIPAVQNENDYYEVNLPVNEDGGTGTLNLYTKLATGEYSEAETIKYMVSKSTDFNTETGVEGIEVEADGEAAYYTLQGVKVANPEKGIYIKVACGKASKVVL